MPQWVPHGLNLRTFIRRWSMQGVLTNVGDLLSGVLPVAVLQRHLQDDEANLWGCGASIQIPGQKTGTIGLVTGTAQLNAPSAFVRRVEVRAFWTTAPSAARYAGESEPNFAVYLYNAAATPLPYFLAPTPPPNLGAADTDPNGKLGGFAYHGGPAPLLFLPHTFARSEAIPDSLVVAGICDELVPQSPLTPALHFLEAQTNDNIGQLASAWSSPAPGVFSITAVQTWFFQDHWAKVTILHDWEDRPIRVLPDQIFAVQFASLNPFVANPTLSFFVTIWWQEENSEAA